jgi:zinc transport system substrate-binding protein
LSCEVPVMFAPKYPVPLGVFVLPALLAAAEPSRADAPEVAVSIQPIHSLVAGVMSGVGAPHLLVKGYGSPHAYQMRPSDAAALYRADLVFWMGMPLETFLVKPLANVRPPARVIALLEVEGLHLLENRDSGAWQRLEHESQHIDEFAHPPQSRDPHAWLSPPLARRMVAVIAEALMRADPRNAEIYRVNAGNVDRRIEVLAAELASTLAPLRQIPFIMFHDAFQYFEQSFGLHSVGAVQLEPDRAPGAARIRALRNVIRDRGVRCVFREPQFQSALVDALVESTAARVSVVDPLGAEFPPGPDAWFQMMTANAEAIAECLARNSGAIDPLSVQRTALATGAGNRPILGSLSLAHPVVYRSFD